MNRRVHFIGDDDPQPKRCGMTAMDRVLVALVLLVCAGFWVMVVKVATIAARVAACGAP